MGTTTQALARSCNSTGTGVRLQQHSIRDVHASIRGKSKQLPLWLGPQLHDKAGGQDCAASFANICNQSSHPRNSSHDCTILGSCNPTFMRRQVAATALPVLLLLGVKVCLGKRCRLPGERGRTLGAEP
eukprot:413027-Pelagomonas_calceolata.AAC.1